MADNGIVRCKRCKRPLTNPVSIAAGMGPKCRGGGGGRRGRVKIGRPVTPRRKVYGEIGARAGQMPLFTPVEICDREIVQDDLAPEEQVPAAAIGAAMVQ